MVTTKQSTRRDLQSVLGKYRLSDVYVMLLDASKAFDKVHYMKLFNLLCQRGLCPVICRLLLYVYTNQTINVKWGSQCSCNVSISNGVKQGGILSPFLFTIYIDVLFTMLKDSGLGCHIGTNFMGAVGYADDIALIAPSVMSLKKMLHICDRFGGSYDVTFNVSKYQLIISPDESRGYIGFRSVAPPPPPPP